MADDQEKMAYDKAHSTVGQALDIGRRYDDNIFSQDMRIYLVSQRMNAQNILLTHFSARYPKMPPVDTRPPSPSGRSRGPTVALAFDHAKIRIGDMWKLGIYFPAIERNFAEAAAEEGDDEQDTATISW